MDSTWLIEQIVRQTMVMLAQIATSGGVRAPLSTLADQVFVSLVDELKRQGVGQKVIADMFGLALRSYQRKVHRLSASVTEPQKSLWQAIYDYATGQSTFGRAEVLARFGRDDESTVGSILADMVDTGILQRQPAGADPVYAIAATLPAPDTLADEALADRAWLLTYRNAPIAAPDLAARCGVDAQRIEPVIKRLVQEGRLHYAPDGRLRAETCIQPAGSAAGWESAIFDHFQALAATLIIKLRGPNHHASAADEIGGSTFTFQVWPGHPQYDVVRSLLRRTRAELSALMQQVNAVPRASTDAGGACSPEDLRQVTFYCGQHVIAGQDRAEGGD